jgi:hypothetical protein
MPYDMIIVIGAVFCVRTHQTQKRRESVATSQGVGIVDEIRLTISGRHYEVVPQNGPRFRALTLAHTERLLGQSFKSGRPVLPVPF